MAVFKFIAKRNLAAGYLVDDEVTFAIPLVKADDDQRLKESTLTSLGGIRQRRLKYTEIFYNIQTIFVSGTDLAVLDMFADSVRTGEPFEVDLVSNDTGGTLDLINLSMVAPRKRIRDRNTWDFAISFSAIEVV